MAHTIKVQYTEKGILFVQICTIYAYNYLITEVLLVCYHGL